MVSQPHEQPPPGKLRADGGGIHTPPHTHMYRDPEPAFPLGLLSMTPVADRGRETVDGGSEITVAKPMHLKSKHTTLSPYAKIVTSRSLASGTLAHHPLHRTQRRRRELGRRTASRESADSLPPRATLFLTTSNFSEEPGLAPPPEAIEHPPLQAAIGTDRVSRLEGHTAIKARGCALVLNYRN